MRVWYAQSWNVRRNNTYRSESAAPSVQVSKLIFATSNICIGIMSAVAYAFRRTEDLIHHSYIVDAVRNFTLASFSF